MYFLLWTDVMTKYLVDLTFISFLFPLDQYTMSRLQTWVGPLIWCSHQENISYGLSQAFLFVALCILTLKKPQKITSFLHVVRVFFFNNFCNEYWCTNFVDVHFEI